MMAWSKAKKAAYNKQYAKKNKKKIAQRTKAYRAIPANNKKAKISLKKWEADNKEYRKGYKKKQRYTIPARFNKSQSNAKARGIAWSLTLVQYTQLISQPCYYCANKLGEATKIACGLDRLDSNKNYTLANSVSCCFVCNVIKGGKLAPEETKVAIKAILRYRKANGITKPISSTSRPRKKKVK